MRVLLMISGIAMGGAERNVVSVLPYLKEIDGVTPLLGTLNTWRDSPLVEILAESRVRRFDLSAKRLIDPAAWKRFISLLDEQKIDIVSTQDQYTNLFGALAFWWTRVPIVMTRHVMCEPTDTFRETVKAKLMLWAARYGSHRLIAVSEAVRENLARQAGVPLSRIETIYNGIDVERFATRDQRDRKRAQMGWNPDQKIVLMVAVLRRGKGHEILFEAISQLKAEIPGVRIKLVGDGELNGSLRRQAEPFGDTVELLGERVDVPELLGASDALVLPSWSEALPTVLMEAGAACLPVVATNVGGAAEIVEEGRSGYLVRAGDAEQLADRLIRTLQNPEQARQLGEYARNHIAELFSLERQAKKMVSLYGSILGTE